MPKTSKRKDKNTEEPKNRASSNFEAGSDASTSEHYDVQYRKVPVKSDPDPNEYRVIELPNGLVALLISCPTKPSRENEDQIRCTFARNAESHWLPKLGGLVIQQEEALEGAAVCCLCVNAGSFSDPRHVPGVARVLGSAIFDSAFENAQEMLQECNEIPKWAVHYKIVPKSETTIFYIKATHNGYRQAIELLEHSLQSVVIPEDQAEISRDSVLNLEESQSIFLTPKKQREHIFGQFVSRGHPANTFGEYYLEGLSQIDKNTLNKAVQKFRKHHYSAHRMTVIMQAELPLDTLETHAKECFSRITNNGLPPELFDSYNFANSIENTKFRRIWRINSADCNEMDVRWIMPPSRRLYRTKSLVYLGWLFNYGGAGSLTSYLKSKEWATEVYSGVLSEPAWNTSLYSTFCVSVTLTEMGKAENELDVLDAIYSYINFLRREGPQKSIYDDIHTIRNAEFRYREADLTDFEDFAKLIEHIPLYPSTDYLAAPFASYEYDPVSLSTCLDLMTPTKACIMINDEHLDMKLACLGSAERSSDMEEDWIERWQTMEPLPVFKLPKRNIFCPDDLRMVDAPVVLPKFPVKVHSDSMSEVWYKFAPELRAPKCNMNFTYMSPLPLESPENAAMLELFALILEDLTHDELYPATVAGLSYTIESYLLGLTIRVSGYTQKLPLLAEVIAQSIPQSYQSLTICLFEMRRKELLDRYSENFSFDLNLARQIRQSIVMSGRWTEVQKHAALACVQLERFQHFVKHFLDHTYIKCLVEGNIAEADTVKTALRVVEVAQCGPLPRNMIPRVRINTIPRGKHSCTVETFRLDSSEVTVENYYQFDDSSVELGGMLRFLVSCSTDLATRVFCESEVASAASCIPAIIKSGVNNYSLALVDSRTSTIDAQRIASVDAGIEEQQQISRNILKDHIEDVWEQAKHTIDAVLRQSVNNYPSEFMNNWEDIVNGEYGFGKPSRQLDALHEMDSADIQKWIKYITDDSNVRKLSVRIVGDKYSRADFSTPETQPDESNNGQQNIPIYRLHYLTENAGQSENTSYNCITDVQEFKKQLEASSNTNVNSC